MDRRAFNMALLGAAVVWPQAAQPARKIPRIGVLTTAGPTSIMIGPEPRNTSVKALLHGLRDLGYVYGQDFVTEPRGGESEPERFPALAYELVRLRVELIVAPGPMLPWLKEATSTMPTVMAGASDPVAEGYIQSLSHPGRNFTGLSNQSVEMIGKRLELLKELVPGGEPVAVLWGQQSLAGWQAAEDAARERKWQLLSLEIREAGEEAGEIERAFTRATEARAHALLVLAGGFLFGRARQVALLAAKSRLPAMYPLRAFVEAGGLISYAANLNDIWQRAAVFVDKILKGANPADLPVEQPTKFELVINGKTARALGLTIPPRLLARADEVIE
jgi:putative tryptophan/tyrosine transport system substrate-binding protein